MALENTNQLQHLKSAFQTFNKVSEQLMSSYHQLESQVDGLNHKLASAHGDYDHQIEQNQSLANRLEHLLDALPGGVIVLNGKGVVQEANKAAIDLLGEPLKGSVWRQVIQRSFEPRVDDGHDISLKDGRRVSITTSSLGKEPGQILLIADVTEKRLLQDKLGRFQRLSAMGQMAASLAHQVRTPTATALLYVSNLRNNATNPEAVEKYSDKVRQQLLHIEAMVCDMLAYVRGSSSQQQTIFSCNNLINTLHQSVQVQVEQNNSRLNISNNCPEIKLKANREAVLGALINLVMNAIQASSKVPLEIDIKVSVNEARMVLISISDNGIGISSDIKADVFEPFVTSRPQGTGLGLAVVKSVIEQHGGNVDLKSEQGRGTKISLTLPQYVDSNDEYANSKEDQKEVLL